MKSIYFILSMVIVFFVFSCEERQEDPIVSNEIADFEITGMVCKMGCGGAIRKELYASGFVDQVDVEFNEEAPSNIISVHFNNTKTSPDKIQELIEAINEGQFGAVFTGETRKKEQEATSSSSSPSNQSNNSFKAETSNWSFPNLTDLLNSLIH
jgi:hypothetical protein